MIIKTARLASVEIPTLQSTALLQKTKKTPSLQLARHTAQQLTLGITILSKTSTHDAKAALIALFR